MGISAEQEAEIYERFSGRATTRVFFWEFGEVGRGVGGGDRGVGGDIAGFVA
jgi:hypothetical protein